MALLFLASVAGAFLVCWLAFVAFRFWVWFLQGMTRDPYEEE